MTSPSLSSAVLVSNQFNEMTDGLGLIEPQSDARKQN